MFWVYAISIKGVCVDGANASTPNRGAVGKGYYMKYIQLTLYTVNHISHRYLNVRRATVGAATADEMVDKIAEMKRDCTEFSNETILFMTMSTGHFDFPSSEILMPVTLVNIRSIFDR